MRPKLITVFTLTVSLLGSAAHAKDDCVANCVPKHVELKDELSKAGRWASRNQVLTDATQERLADLNNRRLGHEWRAIQAGLGDALDLRIKEQERAIEKIKRDIDGYNAGFESWGNQEIAREYAEADAELAKRMDARFPP